MIFCCREDSFYLLIKWRSFTWKRIAAYTSALMIVSIQALYGLMHNHTVRCFPIPLLGSKSTGSTAWYTLNKSAKGPSTLGDNIQAKCRACSPEKGPNIAGTTGLYADVADCVQSTENEESRSKPIETFPTFLPESSKVTQDNWVANSGRFSSEFALAASTRS